MRTKDIGYSVLFQGATEYCDEDTQQKMALTTIENQIGTLL